MRPARGILALHEGHMNRGLLVLACAQAAIIVVLAFRLAGAHEPRAPAGIAPSSWSAS